MPRDPLAPPVDNPDDAPRPPRRRRRVRMGAVIDSLGRKAAPSLTAQSTLQDIERREQQVKARALLQGGRNKGEQKGYGATGGPRSVP